MSEFEFENASIFFSLHFSTFFNFQNKVFSEPKIQQAKFTSKNVIMRESEEFVIKLARADLISSQSHSS